MLDGYYLQVEECPLKAWRLANEGKVEALRIDKNKGDEKSDNEAFELLYNDYLQKIGMSKEFEEYLDLLEQRMLAQIEYIESLNDGKRNRFILNRLKMLEAEILSYQKTAGKGMSITETLLILSKNQGYHLKESELTVLEYYELLKLSQNGGK